MSPHEIYLRQIPLISESGQKKLQDATVFIAGAGGLGSPVAFYLASAGVGTLKIADMDVIEPSNLNRQILHPASKIGMKKAISAQETLASQFPTCHVEAIPERIDETSVTHMVSGADLIVDCMDNFDARYVLNHAALDQDIPLLHGAVAGYTGQLTLVIPRTTPCLSCIFPHAETTTSTPVLGATCGVIGSMQALEAVRTLTGTPTLAGKLLLYDGMANTLSSFAVKKSGRCPVCGEKTI